MSVQRFGPALSDDAIAAMLRYHHPGGQASSSISSSPPIKAPPRAAKCPICLSSHAPADLLVLDPCNHIFCRECLTTHVRTVVENTAKFPIPCPQCESTPKLSTYLALLQNHPHLQERLRVRALQRHHISNLNYCANPKCATAFDFEAGPQTAHTSHRIVCPICGHATCVRCKQLWHAGKKCEQVQAEIDRSGFMELAKQRQWKPCPSCGIMVDRKLGDCNFVLCRCGVGFCHKCGVKYKDLVPNNRNSHGSPACSCGLFDQAQLRPPQQQNPPQQNPPYQNPQRQNPRPPNPPQPMLGPQGVYYMPHQQPPQKALDREQEQDDCCACQ